MDERAKEIVDTVKSRLARCLHLLEATHDDLEYMFDHHREWNSEVEYQISRAAETLGYALATFETWYDDPQDAGGEQ